MMIKRPEGLFPDEAAKAEMHGIGVAAEVTAGSADLLASAEEVEEVSLEAAPILDPTELPDELRTELLEEALEPLESERADREETPQ